MSLLTVRHLTVYRYSEPVGLGEHRMMFRPRESHDLRLVKTRLEITPAPTTIRWVHDVFDNSVAVATFDGSTSELRLSTWKRRCPTTLWKGMRAHTPSAIQATTCRISIALWLIVIQVKTLG